MKVLYLSAWYPTERDAMAGLFVQKHAEAVIQQGCDVRVLYSDNVGIAWLRDMYKGWKRLRREWGLPDVVQMNVLDKNGLLALWLKWRYRIPYILVEHWSGYLPINFSFRGGWHGALMRLIAKNASCILPVSQMLEDAMKACGIENAHWQRVHNVVDDFFYHPISSFSITPKTNKIRFLHVSCFDEKAKNIQGLLRAMRKVAEKRSDFELVLVGTGVDYEQDAAYAKELNFPADMLTFTGEQTPFEVAQWMQQSDCFVLFSNYENAPVVLSECMAVGLPIITSNAGGIPEMVNAQVGVLVDTKNESQLAEAILQFMERPTLYVCQQIQACGQKYTYAAVGQQLVSLYKEVLG
jgi:glycosyltransferase involved in cell wall biosynthesis